jgi:uncharacterized protein (TIGR00255 family)
VTVRLPDSCRALEPELRAALSRVLRRGKIDCTISLRGGDPTAASLEIDAAGLERLLAGLQTLTGALGASSPGRSGQAPLATRVDLIELLRFPGVLRQDALDSEALLTMVRTLFGQTLEELAGARAREGERLGELIRQRCTLLGELVSTVRTHLPEARAHLRQRFEERLAELSAPLDPGRLEQEILLLLQRSDIAEELDRLEGHLTETARTLEADEPAGRRLDFLMQEFNREANTLSSKSLDLATTRSAVEMKVLIEQMREQVQNIE